MIDTLIDKQDSFEIIRDQIAAILATEVAAQMALATTAGKDPALWKLRVFSERSNPWELFNDESVTDYSPVVNVWYENTNFQGAKSNIVERQAGEGTFNIDCVGAGISSDNPAGGHLAGDKEAALTMQRAIRLVRNILMSAEYTYLGLRGVVWQRWPQSVTAFQPEQDNRNKLQIVGARVAMRVLFNETSPQITGDVLETLAATVRRAEDGQVLLETEYDYTT